MARRKIRHYQTKEYYKNLIETHMQEHAEEYMQEMLKATGCKDRNDLWAHEQRMAWGFDCGWVMIEPKNAEMRREWRLDDQLGSVVAYIHTAYNCQSVTLKEIQLEKALRDLNLTDTFYIHTRLD